MLFLKVVMVVSKSQYAWMKNRDGPGTISHEEVVAVSAERYEEFDDIRRKEEARLADEADMEELRRIEDEAKRRGKDGEGK